MCRVVGLELLPSQIHKHWTAYTNTGTPQIAVHTPCDTPPASQLEMANFCSTRTVENGGHRKQAKTLLSYLTFAKNARTHPQAGSRVVCSSTLIGTHIPTPVHFTFVAVAYLCTFFLPLRKRACVRVHSVRSHVRTRSHPHTHTRCVVAKKK